MNNEAKMLSDFNSDQIMIDVELNGALQNAFIARANTSCSRLLRAKDAEQPKAETSLTSRDELLAVVSHDLKNPLGAIRSYAEIILDENRETPLDQETSNFVQSIKRNADIALRMISDLLDLERISHDKLALKISNYSVGEIGKSAFDIFAPIALEKSVELTLNYPDKEIWLDCDHDRIVQILSNLIGNAIKYVPPKGRVTVTMVERGSEVEFSVGDTGPGIPKSKQAEIFERFAQLHSSDRTGLGLGLYIAKTLVEAHGGQIWLESDVGVGSTFKFKMPLRTMNALAS